MYRLTIATMLVLAIAVGGYTQTSRLTTNSSSPSYGKEQADRGKALYSRYCSKCHLENLKGTKHDVWPRTLEVQGKNDFEMSLAMGGNESTYTFDDAARARARKPAGQWNSVEIVSKDGQLWTYLNGALITHVTKHPFTEAGYIGFQVESGPVHWRNIRIGTD